MKVECCTVAHGYVEWARSPPNWQDSLMTVEDND